MQPNGTTKMPPNDSPQATIGGITYPVEVDLLAEYKLSEQNISIPQAFQAINRAENRNVYMLYQLFAAMTASYFMRQGHPAWTAEQWITKIPQSESNEVTLLIGKVVSAAVVKRWPVEKKAETTQATETMTTDRPQ